MTSQHKNLRQQEIARIIHVLSKAIAQHRLLPGTRLVEAQIVEALDANRNHVQAALQRLALQKIITIEPNRGGRVAKPTENEAREVFVARRAIERAVVENITPEAVVHYAKAIHKQQSAEAKAIASDDRLKIVHELIEFHRLLAEMCGNRVLQDFLESLLVRSSIIVALYQRNDVPDCQHGEHEEILAALGRGDNAMAAKMMDQHLEHLESELALDDTQEEPLDILHVLSQLR